MVILMNTNNVFTGAPVFWITERNVFLNEIGKANKNRNQECNAWINFEIIFAYNNFWRFSMKFWNTPLWLVGAIKKIIALLFDNNLIYNYFNMNRNRKGPFLRGWHRSGRLVHLFRAINERKKNVKIYFFHLQ